MPSSTALRLAAAAVCALAAAVSGHEGCGVGLQPELPARGRRSAASWVLGGAGLSCTAACRELGVECDAAGTSALMDPVDQDAALAAAGVKCTSSNTWDYGQGLSQCTGSGCCGGTCVGACSKPKAAGCDATGGGHSRLCYCSDPDPNATTKPTTAPPEATTTDDPFWCAAASHREQTAAAPDWYYSQGHNGRAESLARQPFAANWEPILDEQVGCNGLAAAANGVDRPLKEFGFLVVLDKSWVEYYAANTALFAAQGYHTLETSPNIMFDRVSYLFEAQFGTRVKARRVVPLPNLGQKCATNNKHAENGVEDFANTRLALNGAGVSALASDAGLLRMGVGAPDSYCHSSASLNGLCPRISPYKDVMLPTAVIQQQKKPFHDSGHLNTEAIRTLAHEFGHFTGLCRNGADCQNAHTRNEIPDLMVWDGRPAVNARPIGMFSKFLPQCTTMYRDQVCRNIEDATCGTELTCGNGIDCDTKYWSARGSSPISPTSTGSTASECSSTNSIRDRGAKLPARCCSGGSTPVCASSGLGGLVTVAPDKGCSGPMTWPQAERFCAQAGLRLCTQQELAADVCKDSGCGYDGVAVWTSTKGPDGTDPCPATTVQTTKAPCPLCPSPRRGRRSMARP